MKKKVLTIIVALLAVSVLATPLLGTVEACGFKRRNKMPGYLKDVTVTDMGTYTEYVGNLKGAGFVIRIPDDWNGMLVVGCHGWLIDVLWSNDKAQFMMDLNCTNSAGVGLPFVLVDKGFAYAASSYGSDGWAIEKGMQSTLELSLYTLVLLHWQFRHCGDIKVFLVGSSMGGIIALRLGEKYPNIYDGVLAISTTVDAVWQYENLLFAIQNLPLPPMIRAAFEKMLADIAEELGGTLEENPEAYEKASLTNYAKIRIPVITVYGALDPQATPQEGIKYGLAVAEAGRSEYYRTYVAPLGGHSDGPTVDEALIRFDELVEYPAGWPVTHKNHCWR